MPNFTANACPSVKITYFPSDTWGIGMSRACQMLVLIKQNKHSTG